MPLPHKSLVILFNISMIQFPYPRMETIRELALSFVAVFAFETGSCYIALASLVLTI